MTPTALRTRQSEVNRSNCWKTLEKSWPSRPKRLWQGSPCRVMQIEGPLEHEGVETLPFASLVASMGRAKATNRRKIGANLAPDPSPGRDGISSRALPEKFTETEARNGKSCSAEEFPM